MDPTNSRKHIKSGPSSRWSKASFLVTFAAVSVITFFSGLQSWKALPQPESWEYHIPAGGDIISLAANLGSAHLSKPEAIHSKDLSPLRQGQEDHQSSPPPERRRRREQENSNSGLGMRLLVYMTTHLSEQHKQFLTCWEDAIPRFRILRHADLMIYTSEVPSDKILKQLSGFNNVTVKMHKSAVKQAGARQAMIDPWEQGWFEGYDWVIRLNPDVLIRNETWLLETMLKALEDGDSGPVALVVRCRKNEITFHTDFTAFRPDKMVVNDFVDRTFNPSNVAENHMTNALRRFVAQEGRILVVPGTLNLYGCRVRGRASPIVHHHDIVKFCPNYYNLTDRRKLF